VKDNYVKLFYLLFVFVFITCSDENPVENDFNIYNGTWLWLKTQGGLFPRVIVPEEGVTTEIHFNNGNFKICRNDSVKVNAIYKIENYDTIWDKISYSNIMTDNYNFKSGPDLAAIYSDTLAIWDGMIDGFFSIYKKAK
jgi:hypothetical protein